MEMRIIAEAQRVAAKYEKQIGAWERREILRDARTLVDEGMSIEEAVEAAAVPILKIWMLKSPWE